MCSFANSVLASVYAFAVCQSPVLKDSFDLYLIVNRSANGSAESPKINNNARY